MQIVANQAKAVAGDMSNLPPHIECHCMERLLSQRPLLIALALGNLKEMWHLPAKWMGDDHQGSRAGIG